MDTKFKFLNTSLKPQAFTRHWSPIWPVNDDIIPDFGYLSVKPCRPERSKNERFPPNG